ncbi:helix-turn-helix domain-containing protein [Lentilactobacillus senioris]|nr:helix-turn-helix transcriptional regulator [Lentilactobacillus senioris]
MPEVNPDLLLAVRRKRGELNLTVAELSNSTGISRWTLSPILSGKHTSANRTTIKKLDNWLYQHI